MENHDVDRENSWFFPSGNIISSYLVAKQEELAKGMVNFAL
jgi:hypothetical protein